MRVVLTVNFSPWSAYSGGGQRSTHALAVALAKLGHDVTVVYTKPPWERVRPPADLPYALRWAVLPAVRSRSGAPLRPLSAVSVAREVERLLARDRRRAIVHGNGEEAALVGRLRSRLDLRLVVTPRYPSYPAAMQSGRWRSPATFARLAVTSTRWVALAFALDAADRVCPTSRSSAEEVRRVYGIDEARVRVVPNGVAPEFLEVARRPDASTGPAVFFGRIAREKGVGTLVDALAILGARAPRVVLAGRGAEEAVVRRRVAELALADRVELRPWATPADLATLLSGASVAVLPSWEESFGNVMVEAMAAGVPLVSTRVGSVPEVVDDGTTGVLVPPRDARALAGAIATLRADPARAEALGAAGREHVRRRYAWEATARTYSSIYEELGA